MAATKRLRQELGDQTALFGLITGPFTLASHLRGVDIFLDMFDVPEKVQELMAFCGQVAKRLAGFYIEAGVDVIAVVDPMISQVSAEHFREFMAAESRAVFDFVRESGKMSSYFVCGNAAGVLEAMAECHPDGMSVDENVDLAYAREIAERYQISFGGNIPLTTVMLFGNEVDNMNAVLGLVEKYAGPGYILAPGCDIPFNVPVSNISALAMAIFEPQTARTVLANQAGGGALAGIKVQLPDYAALTRPLIEVITLDSDTCPPCKYMVDATREVAGRVPGGVDWAEYKITKPENVVRMQALGVKNLPTIVINGQVAFVSRIPDLESYQQAILAAAERKG
jgi:uroporphyrinogen decarboxylase